jgi:hypothetical protein
MIGAPRQIGYFSVHLHEPRHGTALQFNWNAPQLQSFTSEYLSQQQFEQIQQEIQIILERASSLVFGSMDYHFILDINHRNNMANSSFLTNAEKREITLYLHPEIPQIAEQTIFCAAYAIGHVVLDLYAQRKAQPGISMVTPGFPFVSNSLFRKLLDYKIAFALVGPQVSISKYCAARIEDVIATQQSAGDPNGTIGELALHALLGSKHDNSELIKRCWEQLKDNASYTKLFNAFFQSLSNVYDQLQIKFTDCV